MRQKYTELNNMETKIVFFGTGEFGAAMMDALFKSGYFIELVITQPDRPVGRSQTLYESPVKKLAKKYNFKIDQPDNLKNFEFAEKKYNLAVVCEYGLIIPKYVLNIFSLGAINVHTSLLPKYRGASPIQSAIMAGEVKTGITIMLMDEKMDHGPILKQSSTNIENDDNFFELRKKMMPQAADLLINTLSEYLANNITPQNQNESEATFCKILSKDDGRIDWEKNFKDIYNLYRGLYLWPGVWTTWDNKRLKLTEISLATRAISPSLVMIENKRIFVGCKYGSIEIHKLQLEGKKELTADKFLLGYKNFANTKLV